MQITVGTLLRELREVGPEKYREIFDQLKNKIPESAMIVYEFMSGILARLTPDESLQWQENVRHRKELWEKEWQEIRRKKLEEIDAEAKRHLEFTIEQAKEQEIEAVEETFRTKNGYPVYVRKDGPDAALRVVRLASMTMAARAKYLEEIIEQNRRGHFGPDELYHLCQSEYDWIKKTAVRCIDKGETVYTFRPLNEPSTD